MVSGATVAAPIWILLELSAKPKPLADIWFQPSEVQFAMSRNAGAASGAGVGWIKMTHWQLLEIKIDASAATNSSHAPSGV